MRKDADTNRNWRGIVRKRFHHPAMRKDRYYGKLSIEARELFNGMIDIGDDEGFFDANPKILRSEIFPYDDFSIEDIKKLRDEIEKVKKDSPMLQIFEVKLDDEEEFGFLPKWFKYQPIPDYPIPSEIVNSLIRIGKLDSKFNGGIHHKFCRRHGGRKAARSVKTLMERREEKRREVGLGLGEGFGLGEIINSYNSLCNTFFPEVKKENLADEEINKIKLRLKKHPKKEWWESVFRKLVNTPFLRGENDRNWRPSFMWIFKNNTHALRIYRGDYERMAHAGAKAWLAEQEVKSGKH